MSRFTLVGLILCLAIASNVWMGESARILCVFPTPSVSHQVVYRGLTLALQKRGHELVVATTNPVNDTSLKNYTEIDLSFLYKDFPPKNFITTRNREGWLQNIDDLAPALEYFANEILSQPQMKELYKIDSNEHFDLVIIETFFTQAYYPLAKRFDAPWIGILSLGIGIGTHHSIGNPLMPSHVSNWEMGPVVAEELTFWKRLKDYIDVVRYLWFVEANWIRRAENVARNYFGDYGSTIDEIAKNVSLIFTYQQLPITAIRPSGPKVIPIGGYHVSKQSTPMTQDLKEFLDAATEGFVYMSLGSNAKSTMLSEKMLKSFITAFSKVPYKVLWKFEDAVLPGKPDNVRTMTWIAQQAVLAHPNLKVFIYQGGLQSTEEALAHAVPLIGFPIFGDQDGQLMKLQSLGVAKRLEITNFEAVDLIDAINTIATDNSYKQRMLDLRTLVNDKPYDPLGHAVWWTEHVLRHKGTPYLSSSTVDLPWYQQGDVDLVAFITATCLVAFGILTWIVYRLVVYIVYPSSGGKKEKTH